MYNFFVAFSFPDALQDAHVFSITCPRPLHTLQVSKVTKVENLFSLYTLLVWPWPSHVPHLLILVPGAAPVPLQTWHFSTTGTSISSLVPFTTSSRDTSRSYSISWPFLVLPPKLNPKPNGSPLPVEEKPPPPKNCSKMSLKPPNPISLNTSS